MNHLELALTDAISRTMEDMAFEQIAPVIEWDKIEEFEASGSAGVTTRGAVFTSDETVTRTRELQTGNPDTLWAMCPLIHPLEGEIVILLAHKQAQEISESLFGFIEPDRSEEIINDALAEVLNTIAGCFMKALISPDQEYEIGFPQTGRGTPPIPQQMAVEMYYEMGNHIVKVMVGGSEFRKMIA